MIACLFSHLFFSWMIADLQGESCKWVETRCTRKFAEKTATNRGSRSL